MNDRKLGEKVCDLLFDKKWRINNDLLQWFVESKYDTDLDILCSIPRKRMNEWWLPDSAQHAANDHIQLCRIGSLARQRKLCEDGLDGHQKLKLAALYTTIPTPEQSKEARQQQFYDEVNLGMQVVSLMTPRSCRFVSVLSDENKHLHVRYRNIVHPKFGVGYIKAVRSRRKSGTASTWYNDNIIPIFSQYDSAGSKPYRKVARLFLSRNDKKLCKALKLKEPQQLLKLAAAHAFYKENGSLDAKLLPTTTTP